MERLIIKKSIKSLLSVRVMRVTLAMVIFISMIINGFVPKNIENKENIVAIMGAVVNNVIVEAFKSYTDTLTVMSNKITKDLYKYLRLGETGTQAPVNGGNEKKETPVNSSSDSGIETEFKEYRELVGYSEDEGPVIISVGKIAERLYRLYSNVKVYCSIGRTMGVLFFIVFIVTIRNRKEDAISEITRYMEDKTNLCR